MDEINELENLMEVLVRDCNNTLLDQIKKGIENDCFLHLSKDLELNEVFIDIYHHRAQLNKINSSKTPIEGLEELSVSLSDHKGKNIHIYSLITEGASYNFYITTDLNCLIGKLINDHQTFESTKNLWTEYLDRGLINKNYHFYKQMVEGDLATFLGR